MAGALGQPGRKVEVLMADKYDENGWYPEETRESSAKTGHTSRFAYTDKHMPGGHYQEQDATTYRNTANMAGGASEGNVGNNGNARNAQLQATNATVESGYYMRQAQAASQNPYSRQAQARAGQRTSQGGQRPQGQNVQRIGNGQYAANGQRPANAQSGQGQAVQRTANGQYAQGQNVQRSANGQYAQRQGGQRPANGQYAQGQSVQRTANGQYTQGQNVQRTANGQYAQRQGGQRTANGQYVQGQGGQRPVNPQYAQAQATQRAAGGAYASNGQAVQRQNPQRAQGTVSGTQRNAQGTARPQTTAQAQAGQQRPARPRTNPNGQTAQARPAGATGRVANGQIRREMKGGSGQGRSGGSNVPPRNPGNPPRSAGSAGRGKPKKKRSAGMIALMSFLLVLLGVLVFVVAFVFGKYSLIGRDLKVQKVHDVDDVYVDEHVKKDNTMSGYTNLLLVGIDSRDSDVIDYANSDTMIICNINNSTGKVRLVSVYRDTYLNIMSPENVNKYQYNKANAAYNLGSAPQLISMINANLDLNIKDYAVVDFKAVIKLVDAVGGIDVTLTDQEAIHCNNYQVETAAITGEQVYPLEVFVGQEPHEYHLNGIQATAYCRIRYTNGWDMKRTQRQRLVIEKVIQKVKAGGIGMANRVLDEVLPLCYTSLDVGEIFSMATKMFNFEIEKTTGFPAVHLGKDVSPQIMSAVIPVTLDENVVELHKWLYDLDSYETSQTVKEFSRQIILNTGYGPEMREEAIADSEIGNSGGEADTLK